MSTTQAIAHDYLNNGYKIILFGQSMGAATVIKAASEMPDIAAVVAWVPDPNVGAFVAPKESGRAKGPGSLLGAGSRRQNC